MEKRVLAFDFGASSGRAMLGTLANGKLELREIHRFSNDPVSVNGTLYWDVLRLYFEIKQGINKAVLEGGFDAVGIDTWGVDFGLLDAKGNLLANPVHYRDLRTEGMMEAVDAVIPRKELYRRTGTQAVRLNSIYQLKALVDKEPDLLKRTDKLLFMPDLFAYFLTGVKRAEYTIASTTGLLSAEEKDWDFELIEKLGIPKSIFPEIIDAGTPYGMLSAEICEELGAKPVPVIAVCTHDTGSAVAAVPSLKEDFLYVSCGTWSLFGTECEKPVVTEQSQGFNVTNEGGYGRNVRLLKNIMGLWLIQESRRQWIREGNNVSFADIEREALAVEPFKCFVDPDYAAFETPGNLPKRIAEYCKMTGQYVPETLGETARCIYQSLAMKYRYVCDIMKKLTGKRYETLHLVGGGGKDGLLCQMAANSCDIEVLAGPTEATALGNVGVQFMALGELDGLKGLRKALLKDFEGKRYAPQGAAEWNAAYAEFLKVTGLKA